MEAGLLAALSFDDAQLQQQRLQVLAVQGRVSAVLVQLFRRALVSAIEQYGKRDMGRRKTGKTSAPQSG